MINERIKNLQTLMGREGIDAYIIPTSDFHESEYVGTYFQVRKYMSGFCGSAGTLLVTKDHAGLWTDGRYFLIAEEQLKGTCIELFKSGQEGVPTLQEFLSKHLKDQGVVGFDGRVINYKYGDALLEKLKDKNITLRFDKDLVGEFWKDRPALSAKPVFVLDIKYTGKSSVEKLADLRAKMQEKKATLHILTSLDDIAWLYNIRGNDVECNPVVLSYTVITMSEALLFINESTLDEKVRAALSEAGVSLRPYNAIYDYVKEIPVDEAVLINPSRINYAIIKSLNPEIKKIETENPTTLAKSVKNKTELDHLRNCHIKDGVAVTKFMYWIKHHVGKEKITEISAADYLESLRKEQDGFIEKSFDTIAGYAHHGAIIHYGATPETDIEVEPKSLFLVDSGGQYFDGTTDITRTFILGEISQEQKFHYTTVVCCALNLANAVFLHGCTGGSLDILARLPFWKHCLDFNHGTGHGVGFLLNVHEGPQRFHWKPAIGGNDCVFEEGMTITDEPGFYVEGSHGIRIENELICVKKDKNEFGQFMGFETMTYAPIDLDGIDVKYMQPDEIQALNQYHALVYQKIAPHLTTEEQEWLKKYTRSLQ